MGRLRHGLIRTLGLGLGVLVVAATFVAARPAQAGATILFPSISVGANVNLSQEVGNQFEGSVAIDPSNPGRIFVLGRDETGNLIGARSGDGGATWVHSRMGTTVTSPDHLPPAWGNTSVTFDAYGNLFVTYLSTTAWTYTDFAMSTDGGATFSHVTTLASMTDQPVVAAGHGEVWVMYNRGGVNTAQGASDTGPGSIGTFGAPQAMPGANGGAFGDLSIGPAGQVVAAFGSLVAPGPVTISVNGGLASPAFQPAVTVSTTNVGGFDYIPAAPNWGIDAEAHLAWDQSGGPHNGRLYLSYLDAPPSDLGATKLYVMHSDDGGVTWSPPVLVNDDGTSASHFMPGFAVDQTTGAVGATWYDTRGDPTRVTARYFGSVSVDGGDTWSPNFPVSAGSSDALLAAPPPSIRNTNWGDYTGLAFQGGVMVPVWADNSNSTANNPAGGGSSFDLYTSVVSVTTAPAAPSVVAPPVSATVTAGTPYAFTASASGSPAPSVQWQRSNDGGVTWAPIAGATSNLYSAPAAAGDDGARFEAVYTNAYGTATSAPATLSVLSAPAVTTSPTATTVASGTSYTFTASASGSPTPTVQWQRSNDGGLTWAPIAGATATSYTSTAAPGDDGARFEAVFTNSQGSATSAAAALTVTSAPVVTSDPLSTTVAAGSTYSFTAAASGSPTPTVQWMRSNDNGLTWAPIAGASATTYSATAIPGDQGAQFEAVFTNASGTATSLQAGLYVTVAPVVTSSPTSTSVSVGSTYTLDAGAVGSPAPSVQWMRSNDGGVTWLPASGGLTTVYPGSTTTTFSATAGTADDGARFEAVFTNAAGSATTTAATVTVSLAPTIVSSPVSQTVNVGTTYPFMAVAYAYPAPTVQWQRSNDGGLTWAAVPGATGFTYAITAALGDNGARFRAVFANRAGTATTAVATLGVTTTTSISFTVAHATLKGGKPDTLAVTVTSPTTGKGKVSVGTVTFYDGATALGTVPVVKGRARLVVRPAKGTHPLRALYNGSGAVLPAQSAVVTVTAT